MDKYSGLYTAKVEAMIAFHIFEIYCIALYESAYDKRDI